MKVAHQSEIEFERWPGMRGEKFAMHRTLLQGEKNSPVNYEFGIATYDADGYSPRHRHAFDQFRLSLKGELEYSPGRYIPEGSLCYFPEGTYYGPFNKVPGHSLVSLQFGGPSGQGFVHRQDLDAAHKALKTEGRFEKGIYHYTGPDGQAREEDGHDAAWRHVTGKALRIPEPRYADPILIHPQAYHWRAIGPSVSEKLLGVFNERNTYVKMLRLGAGGRYRFDPGRQNALLFVTEGAVNIGDSDLCQKHDAVHLQGGEQVELAAMAETTLLVYGMPQFD